MNKININTTSVNSVPVPMCIDGVDVNYELREMMAGERDKYLDQLSKRIRLDATGKPCGIQKFEGMHAELLSRCMFKGGDTTPVPMDTVQKWPATVVAELFKEAQKLNRLTEDEKADPAKNG